MSKSLNHQFEIIIHPGGAHMQTHTHTHTHINRGEKHTDQLGSVDKSHNRINQELADFPP